MLSLLLSVVVLLAMIALIFYGYIKAWIWLGGKVGETIDRLVDARQNRNVKAGQPFSINISLIQNNPEDYFDRLLYGIQCKKQRNQS